MIHKYSKALRSLWQCHRNETNATLIDSDSFKSKVKITGSTPNYGNIKDDKIAVPLKYLSNFRRTLEIF